ncbi:MAG: sulfotransferase [Acidimicrobiia bacterium]|nr:sulfotransferase [Acidimicrobiia bacterium]MYG73823.1 sulfotransferase [Acidimicrobiia bacterium]MYH96984.1 sulfotransferase [Acidimicrobiia bacterium]MYL09761.1 sulfotransferase [Acidimicrobiia bacterium]
MSQIQQYHAAAVERTGLDDFGSDDYLEGLTVLEQSLEAEAAMTDIGRFAIGEIITQALMGRLRAEAGLKARPEAADVAIEQPLVIIGLPRTGTTALHQLMAASPHFQGLELWLAEMPQPRPPRDQWEHSDDFLSCKAKMDAIVEMDPERAAIHLQLADNVDECWNIFRQSFASVTFECLFRIPTYSAWWAACDMGPAYAQHRRSIGLIGVDEPDARWILKDPSHLFAPEALFATYPDANVVMTHRDPLKALASVCSLTAVSRQGFEELPDNIVHGAEQTELWARGIERLLAARAGREDRFYDLHFADFQRNPLGSVAAICDRFGYQFDTVAEQAVAQWAADHPKGEHGVHDYSPEQYGLRAEVIHERYADYIEACGVAVE